MAVVITHFHWSKEQRLLLGFPFWIEMAVPIFMLISGYVYAISYHRHAVDSFADAYNKNRILKAFIRYTVPFLIIFFIECLFQIIIYIVRPDYQVPNVLYSLITGGWGPGSYYYPLLIQFIFLYPVLYFLIKKYNMVGLCIVILMNAGWEFLKVVLDVSPELYRLLVFRYVLLISVGIYTYLCPNKLSKKALYAFFMIGISFIVYTAYFGNKVLFLEQWTGTCFVASMYVMPIFYIMVNKTFQINKSFDPIKKIGMASYNIFLFQMLYYKFLAGAVYNYIHYTLLQFVVCIFFPLIVGNLFFTKEDIFTKNIIKKILLRRN